MVQNVSQIHRMDRFNKPMLSCLIKMWACGNTGLYQIPCVAYSIENRDSHCSIIDSVPGAFDALYFMAFIAFQFRVKISSVGSN